MINSYREMPKSNGDPFASNSGVYHCPAWRLDEGANTLQVTATTLDNVIVLGGVPGGTFRGTATFHGTGTPVVTH